MNLNRLTILLIIFVAFARQSQAQEFKIFSRAERLEGNVKTIVETRLANGKGSDIKTNSYDIRDSIKSLHERPYSQKVKSSAVEQFEYFDRRYVKNIRHIDTTRGTVMVDAFSARTGDVVSENRYVKDSIISREALYCENLLDYDEELGDKIYGITIKNADGSFAFRQRYFYNNSGFLVKAYNYLNKGAVSDSIIFTYLKFDGKGNWIKRSEKNTKLGKVIRNDTVTRKITYY